VFVGVFVQGVSVFSVVGLGSSAAARGAIHFTYGAPIQERSIKDTKSTEKHAEMDRAPRRCGGTGGGALIDGDARAEARDEAIIALEPPPVPPQRRGARSILHMAHQSKSDLSRTPSPPKSTLAAAEELAEEL
jgi:hypothetical protein